MTARRLRHPTPAWRVTVWLLVAGWLAFIGYMTLTSSQPHSTADSALQTAVHAVTGRESHATTTGGGWERVSNVALFAPLGLVLTLALAATRRFDRRRAAIVAVTTCVVLSGVIELLQAVAVTTRHASAQDVLDNAIGGVLGAALGLLALTMVDRRAPG